MNPSYSGHQLAGETLSVYAVETSSRVDPSVQATRVEARPLAARSSDVATQEVTTTEVALEEDGSFEWFVNLLLAENASKA
jgi:hypothetical protein